MTVELSDDICALVARSDGGSGEVGVSEVTFLRVTSARRILRLTDRLQEKVEELLLQLPDIPDSVLEQANGWRFWMEAKQVSLQNIALTINSGDRMIAGYKLCLVRIAQLMNTKLKVSSRLPYVEHSRFGLIVKKEAEN